MTEIRLSNVDEMHARANELLREHWIEIARNKQVMVLKPDWTGYREMERQGKMLCLAAWDGDDMVGYSANFVVHHLHYADLVMCTNDVLFVTKSHRVGRTGIKLMRETERLAKETGAQLMLWHAKENTDLAAICPRMGYGVQDIIFSKEI